MRERRKCWTCERFVYLDDYFHPDDMTVCGYCFADKLNEIYRRQAATRSEVYFIADAEIRLDEAKKRGDTKAIAIYEQFLRMLNA